MTFKPLISLASELVNPVKQGRRGSRGREIGCFYVSAGLLALCLSNSMDDRLAALPWLQLRPALFGLLIALTEENMLEVS